MSGSTFVEVLLPLPLNQTLTYKIPDALIDKVVIGSRVVVSLGPKKLYTGFVAEIHTNKPENFHVKEILEVLDSLPMLLGRQLEFWKWIASYYMCTVGEVLHAALPSGLKLESETRLRLVAPVESEENLSEQEKQIVSNIELNQVYTLKNFATKIGNKRALVLLQSLVDKGLVEVFENLNQSKQKGVSMIQLDSKYETQPELVEIDYAQLSRAKNNSNCWEHSFYCPNLDKSQIINLLKDLCF
jgi:primosomal protein N' (replication factor Y) (superfamily II helicase)